MQTTADPEIRALQTTDLEAALGLSTSAGWNQQLADWILLRTIAAGGGFAAAIGPQIVGTALAIDYRGFTWIAMMLVDPAWRGRGLGARLLQAALQTAAPDRPVRLDATEAGRPLYRRYGFQDEAVLTRLVAPAARPLPPPGNTGVRPRPMTPTDLSAIARHDPDLFGGNRTEVLEWAFAQAPAWALIADGRSAPPQYCLGRPGRRFAQIGPVVADNESSAAALVAAALASAEGRPVVVDAFDVRESFTAWLRAAGFRAERPLFRMRTAPATAAAGVMGSPSPREHAIFGPDFG